MIVTCPSCHSKYSVQAAAIGEGKFVRCVMCGTVWQQSPLKEPDSKSLRGINIIKWAFFWSSVFLFCFFIFFSRSFIVSVWPPAICFYDFMRGNRVRKSDPVKITKVSNFFDYRGEDLYMGLRGELQNISNEVQILPTIAVSLREGDATPPLAKDRKSCFKTKWTHDMLLKKILPNQKISFEMEPQKIPCKDISCDIRLRVL